MITKMGAAPVKISHECFLRYFLGSSYFLAFLGFIKLTCYFLVYEFSYKFLVEVATA